MDTTAIYGTIHAVTSAVAAGAPPAVGIASTIVGGIIIGIIRAVRARRARREAGK